MGITFSTLYSRRGRTPLRIISIGVIICVLAGGSASGEAKKFKELNERAQSLAKAGKVDEALPYYREAVRLEPYNENARFKLAEALLLQKNAEPGLYRKNCGEALRILIESTMLHERISERGEVLSARYFYLGLAKWYCGDPRQAASAFARSYRADFTRREALFNEFAVFEELGASAEAELAWNAYVKATEKKKPD